MREIRFRALIYCATCGEHGFQYWVWNGQQFIEDGISRPCQCPLKCEMDGKIQQYTGLEDKNGKSIYEGDIVDYQEKKWVVEFDDGEVLVWWLDCGEHKCGSELNRCDTDYYQVIGSIHENPELLGE